MGPDERALLLDAFDSNWVAPLGPHVDAFEREMCERLVCGHAAALSSGTGALHLALILAGVKTGDEVLCSSLTFAASVNAVTYVGARPVLIDADRRSWNLDPALVCEELDRGAKVGKPARAVVTVDLYGQCADYARIREACDRYSVALIEDAAEALGASYRGRAAGTLGDLGILSFNGNKIITTSGGGMLLSDRKDWIERARFLATQARDPAPHYQHTTVGYNYRMSNLLAAVGRGQLRVLDQRVARRREINAWYQRVLGATPGISFMPEADYGVSNRWLTVIQVEPEAFGASREDIRLHLESLNIEARPVWKPMNLQPVFADCRFVGSGVCNELFDRGLCLPSGTAMTESDLERVVAGVLEARKKVCGN
jgi:dTDP-4-amino-4,6-dideoxygalactose transaminase